MTKAEFRSNIIALELDHSLSRIEYLNRLNELVREYINSPDM
jgi:hypothetical protein